ncbi:MAG TPA: PQQ-dependent sugar dehydrogenase [Parvibaculum sp.]|jgi:glucose/arabinose dehydrogenase
MLRKILVGLFLLILAGLGGAYAFWPKTWIVNAPMTNSLFGWGIDAAPEAKLREQLKLPAGYQISRYAVGLGQARIMRWTSGGDLLVSIPRKGEIALIGRDTNKRGRGGAIKALLTGLNKPHGIEILNGYLYVGETDAIVRVPFDEQKGEITGKIERILTGLPGNGNHWARTLRLGPDGWIYVNVGSDCNACIEKDKRRAAILRFRPDGSGEEIFAEGLRNTTGFDFDANGALWGVDNGRDLLGDDIPPEELNHIEQGKFYGWPFRYGDNVPDPEFGATGDPRAAAAVPPALALPAHAAPLSIKFLHGVALPGLEKAALVTFHGSWNRAKKQGYEVVSLHWGPDGKIAVEPFITGFQKNEDVIGRPVDTVQGPDGAIYVSDDYAGVIYRVSYGASAAASAEAAPAAPQPATPAPVAATAPQPVNAEAIARGEKLFDTVGCKNCHGGDRPMVELRDLPARYSANDIAALLLSPPASMPAFPQLQNDERHDLAAYLLATYKRAS